MVNADSMQVYRDLRALSARPSPTGRGGGRASPVRACRRGGELFGPGAGSTISRPCWRLAADDRLAIVVGGTGMYFKAATQGLSEIPACRRRCARVRASAEERVASRPACPAGGGRSADGRPAAFHRSAAHPAGAGGFGATGKPLAFPGRSRRAAAGRRGLAGFSSRAGARRAAGGDRRAFRGDDGAGRAGRGYGAEGPEPRSGAAGHAGAWSPA